MKKDEYTEGRDRQLTNAQMIVFASGCMGLGAASLKVVSVLVNRKEDGRAESIPISRLEHDSCRNEWLRAISRMEKGLEKLDEKLDRNTQRIFEKIDSLRL